MSEQSSLFSHVPIGSYRKADPDTSKEAARSTDVTLLELAVLEGLSPLVRKCKVRDSGQRRKGRNSIVWELA